MRDKVDRRIKLLEGTRTARRIVVVNFRLQPDAAERLAELKRDDDPNLTILVVRYGGAARELVTA